MRKAANGEVQTWKENTPCLVWGCGCCSACSCKHLCLCTTRTWVHWGLYVAKIWNRLYCHAAHEKQECFGLVSLIILCGLQSGCWHGCTPQALIHPAAVKAEPVLNLFLFYVFVFCRQIKCECRIERIRCVNALMRNQTHKHISEQQSAAADIFYV